MGHPVYRSCAGSCLVFAVKRFIAEYARIIQNGRYCWQPEHSGHVTSVYHPVCNLPAASNAVSTYPKFPPNLYPVGAIDHSFNPMQDRIDRKYRGWRFLSFQEQVDFISPNRKIGIDRYFGDNAFCVPHPDV